MEPRVSRPDHGCRRFVGKTCICTGGTLGIGRAIVERLCEEGATVFVCSRREENVSRCLEELQRKGYSVGGIACNVGKISDLERLVESAVEYFDGKQIDCVVSNAGVNPVAEGTLQSSETVYDKIFQVNLKSYWQLVKLCSPRMNDGGSVLLLSSIGGFQPAPPAGLYGVSKAGAIALAKVLAQDLGTRNIRVNCIAPGLIKTRMSEFYWKGDDHADMKRAQIENTHLKRLGEPEDIAGVASFLLSRDASYVTGETIIVSGGGTSRM